VCVHLWRLDYNQVFPDCQNWLTSCFGECSPFIRAHPASILPRNPESSWLIHKLGWINPWWDLTCSSKANSFPLMIQDETMNESKWRWNERTSSDFRAPLHCPNPINSGSLCEWPHSAGKKKIDQKNWRVLHGRSYIDYYWPGRAPTTWIRAVRDLSW